MKTLLTAVILSIVFILGGALLFDLKTLLNTAGALIAIGIFGLLFGLMAIAAIKGSE